MYLLATSVCRFLYHERHLKGRDAYMLIGGQRPYKVVCTPSHLYTWIMGKSNPLSKDSKRLTQATLSQLINHENSLVVMQTAKQVAEN